MEDRPVALIGMMGAGKTAVGRVLARRLGRPFVDADDELVAREGRSVAEQFATYGEAGFRDREAVVLAQVLDRRPPVVVATGGGAVARPANRQRLREAAVTVWLRAPVPELAERVGSGRDRPLLGDDPQAALATLLALRAGWYAETAHLVVDTARRRPSEVADEIVAALVAPASPAGGGRA
jgi:shikimate kinase